MIDHSVEQKEVRRYLLQAFLSLRLSAKLPVRHDQIRDALPAQLPRNHQVLLPVTLMKDDEIRMVERGGQLVDMERGAVFQLSRTCVRKCQNFFIVDIQETRSRIFALRNHMLRCSHTYTIKGIILNCCKVKNYHGKNYSLIQFCSYQSQ